MKSSIECNTEAFFRLVGAGLWEKEVQFLSFDKIDFTEVYRLAEEQSVVGLVAAGIEHIVNNKVPQEIALTFVGSALQLEQRNQAMNVFIGELVDKMRSADISALLVKGQGVAQCYERPLWRAAGDVDFYLSKDNYEKAKKFLLPLANNVDEEDKKRLHLGFTLGSWIVELHGSLRNSFSKSMNAVCDEVHQDLFYGGSVRSWNNGGTQLFLPGLDDDVIIIFSHFINHFYGEGVGLRQICDWCRLLWKYKNSINLSLLEKRIRRMRLMTEWRVFGVFAIDFLGMPIEAMPFIDKQSKYVKRANKIACLIIKTGSFGSNNDSSYRQNSKKWKGNLITFYKRMGEFSKIAKIFPLNALVFFVSYSWNKMKSAI